jgi:DNA-binding protein YbaB
VNDDELLAQMPEAIRPMVQATLALRARMAEVECVGSDKSGLVTAVTDVMGTLREIRLHPTAHRTLDNLSLGDGVRDAVNAATAQAKEEYRRLLDTVEVFGIPLGQARADPGAAARRFIASRGLDVPR